jgi:hypothetical protein
LVDLVGGYPQAAFGFVFLGGLATLTLRERCHDRFLSSFNDDVLTPVDELHRPDRDEEMSTAFVQLPWTPGEIGPRRDAWDNLKGWCARKVGPAWNWREGSPLSLGVLTGRAGSGKSRMGFELARVLARRDLLGSPFPRAVLAWRIGVYCRHAIPGMRRRDDDPWDMGLLAPPHNYDFEYLYDALEEWWPRRPTILLLDDPLPGRVGAVWKALVAAYRKRPFRFPVCLLVMNQTVPIDTGLEFDPASDRWKREGKPADPPPFSLPVQSWFDPQETLRVAFGTGQLRHTSPAEQKALRENLFRITQGNPLLVELAVEWIRDRRDIEGMTGAELSVGRATRILAALKHRGVEHDSQLAALALTTLVGGAPGRHIDSEIKRLFAIPQPLPGFPVLRACFPTDPMTAGDALRIPAIRPDIVGDAFIDQVLAMIGSDRATALAEAAFRLDFAYMLRNLRRARPGGSAMTKALVGIDPGTIAEADPVLLALGFADVAAICQPDDTPLSTLDSRSVALKAALRMISRLDAPQRRRFCEGMVALCTIPPGMRAYRQLRPEVVMRLMNDSAEGAALVAAEKWIALFDLLERRAIGDLGQVAGMALTASLIGNESLADQFAASAWLMGPAWRAALAPVFHDMAEASAARNAEARGARFETMASVAAPEEAGTAAGQASAIACMSLYDRAIQCEAAAARRYEAYAWSVVCGGAKASEARTAADAAAKIAARFADNPAIQGEAAGARAHEAYAWSQVLAGVKSSEAQGAADAAASISAHFIDDPAIQRRAANARTCEAYAWGQVPAGEKASEARAAADTAAATAARFADDPTIQREAATARRHEAYAWSQVPAGAKALGARTAADAAAEIAARFADDPTIQREAAAARAHVAYAWSQVPAGVKASEVRRTADAVAAIAAHFTDDSTIQRWAAYARAYEAYAWGQLPAGAKASEGRSAADAATAIAARFADDPAIQREAAGARAHEAYAWCEVPAGGKALEARAAADAAASIAARFTDDPAIQRRAADARTYEAYAWSQVPAGTKASEAKTAADAAGEIAAKFTDDSAIQRRAAEARAHEAYAWSQVPAGAKASEAKTAAAAAAEIAAQFTDDPAIQQRAAEARAHEAYAWSQVPAGAKASEAKTAAAAAAEIAAHFTDDPAI